MDTDRLLRELTNFLRIPSVSTNASHNADCRAAAEWVAGELRRLGCREVQFLASGTHPVVWGVGPEVPRSEEHTSELQSQSNLVCRLLLEKKKDTHNLPQSLQQCQLVYCGS